MARDTIITMSLIDKSPLITIGDEEIVDLTKQSFSSSIQRKIGKKIVIDRSLSGKPHLISKAVYGTQNMIDLLFSYNGYSNPLTVKTGDIMYAPDLSQLQREVTKINNGKQSNLAIKELNKRIPETDKKRIEFLKKSQNNVGDISTPNMNESVSQFDIDENNSVVNLGSDVNQGDALNDSVDSIINNLNTNNQI